MLSDLGASSARNSHSADMGPSALALVDDACSATQTTIAAPAMCFGIGLHSGARVKLALLPAGPDHGIVFFRTDITDRDNRIPAHVDFVSTTRLGTTLRNAAGVEIATVEHLLAALRGLEIDNVRVEIDGPEAPILDGSSVMFTDLFEQVGVKALGVGRRAIRVLKPVEVRDGAKWARLTPCDGFELEVSIHFEDPAIGAQTRALRLTRETFLHEIAAARTFGFAREVEALRKIGLARGGSLSNAIVVEDGAVLNPEGLRFEDEFVRHKILDCIGDLALLGAPLLGRLEAFQPGHGMNLLAARALLANPDCWEWEPPALDLAHAV